jgi:hypothetical protein
MAREEFMILKFGKIVKLLSTNLLNAWQIKGIKVFRKSILIVGFPIKKAPSTIKSRAKKVQSSVGK